MVMKYWENVFISLTASTNDPQSLVEINAVVQFWLLQSAACYNVM